MKNVSNLEAYTITYVRFSMFKLVVRPFFIPRILQWIFSLMKKIFWSYNWVSNYTLQFFLRIQIFCLNVKKFGLWKDEEDKKSQNKKKLKERQRVHLVLWLLEVFWFQWNSWQEIPLVRAQSFNTFEINWNGASNLTPPA